MEKTPLTRKQFDILAYLEQNPTGKTQRDIGEAVGMSLGSVNRTISSLLERGLLLGTSLTDAGREALEPYRAKRAVFFAAGFGHRLVPITLNTPKPLIRVNGVRIIDTLIDAVLAAGIEEIYIVRGYLGEQFDQLLYKYPMIHFIENPEYIETNNISSALCARHLLQNAYVFEADLVLYNPKLIQKYQYTSNYLGVPVDTTDDWCLETKNKIITKVTIGGTNGHLMYGISYWNGQDGAKLREDIKRVYDMPGGRERFWDLVPLEYCLNDYKTEVRTCDVADIAEIDTYSDLKKLDSTYR